MAKVIQVVVYKSVSDPEKLAAYAVLARPAMEKQVQNLLQGAFPSQSKKMEKQ